MGPRFKTQVLGRSIVASADVPLESWVPNNALTQSSVVVDDGV